jgi:uncharacterized membrane protein (DUF106 family)
MKIFIDMKLLKTIKKLIEESEKRLNEASELGVSEKELDRLEENYTNSLKLLKLYKNKENKIVKDSSKKS